MILLVELEELDEMRLLFSGIISSSVLPRAGFLLQREILLPVDPNK